MNATSIALSSQDILYQILSYSQLTQSDLYSCCQVSTEWAAAGLILLWRYPKCRSVHTFRLLLDTLRHEDDQSAPMGQTIGSYNTQKHTMAKRSATMWNKSSTPSAFQLPTTGSLANLLPTIYPSHRERKAYGIPFHGQRLHRRAQFIREIDFRSLIGNVSNHHFEILARSTKIGFRTLDLRTVQVPFSNHLLSILQNSRSLRKLCLSKMFIPAEGLICLDQCFSNLHELRYELPAAMCDNEASLILQHCGQLKTLEIRGEHLTDESLSWIHKSCTELETLIIEAPLMTDNVIEQIAIACTRLKSWSLIDCICLEDRTAEILEQKYNTYNSDVSTLFRAAFGATIENSSFASTEGSLSSKLSFLSVTPGTLSQSSSAISSPSTCSMYSHPDIEYQSLTKKSFDQGAPFVLDRYSSTLDYTNNLGMLSTFDIRNCTGISPVVLNRFLRSQIFLENLNLGGSTVTDDALASLTEIPLTRLQSLGFYGCNEISDETMVALIFNCDQIKKLTIFGSNFTYKTFKYIPLHLRYLEELHLEHVNLIMNESMQEILMRCNRLRVLKLWHCRSLSQEIFTDQSFPCESLEELDFMDKTSRSNDDGCKAQIRFLESLITRFERLKILRLAKLAESRTPVNLVAYLCQFDQLEKFTLLQNPGLMEKNLMELQILLPSLIHLGVGTSGHLSEEQIVNFTQTHHRPGIQLYRRWLESSDEIENYVK